jgi:hypothetical protein
MQQETMSRRGALIFKGDTNSNHHSKKSKKSRHNHIDSNHVTQAAAEIVLVQESSFPSSSILPPPKPSLSSPPQQQQQQQQQQPHPIRGSGKIVVSGTVVTGYHTQFNTELQVGDAILIHDEMRIVTMRLSNTALNLSSALSMSSSSSLSSTTKEPVSYYYIQKPRDIHQERVLAETKAIQQQAADIERHQNAFATTSSTNNNNNDSDGVDAKNVLVYRERTEHGNYRIKRMKVDDVTDRSDLLELRSKKTSDKYC